jgi:hypothetical protein
MAQALRTVWLEPEEREPVVLQVRPRRRRRLAPAQLQRPTVAVLAVALLVGVAVLYINGHARIARNDLQRQQLHQALAELDRECVQLSLTLDRMGTQPHLIQTAQAQGLDLPTADRVHYIRVAHDPRHAETVQAQARPSWLARTHQRMKASLSGTLARLSRGPGDPAYAQQ